MSSLLLRHGAKLAAVLAILALTIFALSLLLSTGDPSKPQGKPAADAGEVSKQQPRGSETFSIAPPIAPARKSVLAEPPTILPQALDANGSTAEGEERRLAILGSLQEAATTYSPEGIPLIEPSLYSSDREVREAAADALVVLGETGGAKALRKAAAKSRDPREAVALIERAEYLELPPAKLSPRDNQPDPARATAPALAPAPPTKLPR